MSSYTMTRRNGTTANLGGHFELRSFMEVHGLRYSELAEHVKDVDAGHTVTAEDGTAFTLAQAATTAYPTNATFLAHTSHADRRKRDDRCRLCADLGATWITWAAFAASYPEWNAR